MRTSIVLVLIVGGCLAQRRGNRKVPDGHPCKQESGVFPHEEYCDKYYECYKDEYTVVDCPNGLMFLGRRRGLFSNCDYPYRVNCGGRTRKNPPLGSKPCAYLYGIAEHETSCTKYYTCWNGTAILSTCHKGLLWNKYVPACDWPQNVEGCQTHPLCENSYDQITDYPGTKRECFKYVQCIGGYPRVQKCSAGMAYSPETKSCRIYHEVPECAEYFTTTPSPESEDYSDEEDLEERDPKPRNNRFRNRVQQQSPGPRRQGRL